MLFYLIMQGVRCTFALSSATGDAVLSADDVDDINANAIINAVLTLTFSSSPSISVSNFAAVYDKSTDSAVTFWAMKAG